MWPMDSSWRMAHLEVLDQDSMNMIARRSLFTQQLGEIIELHYKSNIHDLKASIWLPHILYGLLIKDEALIEHPIFAFLYSLFNWKCIRRFYIDWTFWIA